MDGNAEYIDLLERSLAGETETVRLYLACMAVAPPEHTPDITDVYHYNRTMRLVNTIANDIYQQFSDGYIGAVNNNEQGRMMFKSAIVGYLLTIQANNGIQNFEADDVEVLAGEAVDAIVVNLAIQPVGSVNKIYVTLEVN